MTRIGTVADVPSFRVTISESVNGACPAGAAIGKGNWASHCPGPDCERAIACEPICSFAAVAFVVLMTATCIDVPFLTIVGDNVA